jgi:hypothetical protein
MQVFAKRCFIPSAVIISLGIASCESNKPAESIVTSAGAIVTPVPDVTEFLDMPGLAACGFRYSGAPLALSLEIYLQSIAQSDWNDLEKRKEIVRSAPDEKDRKVDWDSIQPDLIDSFEAGTMPAEVAEFMVTNPTGKILLAIPAEWYSDPQPGHVSISGEGTNSAKQWRRFELSEEFRGIDQRVVSGSLFTPQASTQPVNIGYGETAQLVYFSNHVHFGDGPEEQSPVYRLVVELKARCLYSPSKR